MAINYTEVGWDTSKYVNPTNMNKMDDGIKAACDGVDALNASQITISNGYVVGSSNVSVTIPTLTPTTISSITVPSSGLWLVQAHIYLPETSDTKGVGLRRFWLYINDNSVPNNRIDILAPTGQYNAFSGVQVNNIFRLAAGATVYFRVYQNSGKDMSTETNSVLAAKLMNA